MKKTALTFSLLFSLSAIVLTGCKAPAAYKKTDNGKERVLFTVGEKQYTADDLFGLTNVESSYNFLATDDGVNHVYESVYGSLAKANVTRDAVIKLAVKDKMADFDEEVEEYASANNITVRKARKQKLEELGLESKTDLEEQYYVEEQLEALEDMYEDEMFEIATTSSNYQDSMLYRYVKETKPMVVRHVLSKVSNSSTIYTSGVITESEITNFATIVQRFALQKDTFKTIAIEESQDGSASKGGSVGIVDTYTSFVQPFKLGLYYNQINSQNDSSKKDEYMAAYGVTSDQVGSVNSAYGQMKSEYLDLDILSIATVLNYVAKDKAVKYQEALGYEKEADYDETIYPRNALYNEYLNNNLVHSIHIPQTVSEYEANMTALLNKLYPATVKGETCYEASDISAKMEGIRASDMYKALVKAPTDTENKLYDQYGNLEQGKVTTLQENGKNIIFVKSDYGFHFMTIDMSTVEIGVEAAYQYFMYGTSAAKENTYVTNTDTTGYTSASVAKSSRKSEIYDRVYNYIKGGFESKSTNANLYEYEVFEYYLNKAGASFISNSEIAEAINDMISAAKNANVHNIEESRSDSWESYAEGLNAWRVMANRLYKVTVEA